MGPESVDSTPTLIKTGTVLFPIWGCLLIVLAVMQSIGLPDAIPLVGRPRGTWSFALWNLLCLAAGILLVAVGYAFWKELTWARPVVLVFWWLQALLAVTATVLTVGQPLAGPFGGRARGCSFDFTWILGLVLAWWYFYRKVNVVEYYGRLERRARFGAAA